jgi:DNA polymerase III delta prime subunit
MIPKLFISPSLEARVEEIKKFLASHLPGGNLNHPDVLYFDADSKLGIEQARIIKEHFYIKPYQLEGKVVVLENASALTLEAQNGLLKTLEEAPGKAVILLGANSEQDLLPTVLSRCELIYTTTPEVAAQNNTDYESDITKLINSTLEERFEYIEKLKERDELLTALIVFWRQRLLNNPSKENQKFIKELMEAEKWANQNVNIRAILEYLMLIMPKLK